MMARQSLKFAVLERKNCYIVPEWEIGRLPYIRFPFLKLYFKSAILRSEPLHCKFEHIALQDAKFLSETSQIYSATSDSPS